MIFLNFCFLAVCFLKGEFNEELNCLLRGILFDTDIIFLCNDCDSNLYVMSYELKRFNIFAPVLSSNVIEVEEAAPNSSAPVVSDGEKSLKNKGKKNGSDLVLPDCKLPQTPEEIEAWIAERKARYPTRSRIAQKQENERERMERGALDLTVPYRSKRENEDDDRPTEVSSRHKYAGRSILDVLNEEQERRDRSLILQCFRYFVQNEFLV